MIRSKALFFYILFSTVVFGTTPNLVVILIDDMGWNDVGFSGNEELRTPNLDLLAESGIIFEQAYAAAPNCAPTRACLMTGQYPPRHGIYTVVDDRHKPGQPHHKILAIDSVAELSGETVTLAELMKDAEYSTCMVGMWNLGRGRRGPHVPTSQGFDRYVQPKDLNFEKDAYFNDKGEYLTDRMTDEAIDFVENHSASFFLYVAYHAVHSPFDPKPALLKSYGSRKDAAYAATIEALDQNIGRLVKALPENTYLFFTSDNGGNHRYTAPLKGGKGTLYEGGIRVPAFMAGPGIQAMQKANQPISTIDIAPTLLDLAKIEKPSSLDGLSLKPLWNNETLDRESLYWHFPCYIGRGNPSSAMRKGDLKIIEFFETGEIELYDLSKDPGEGKNLAKKKPDLTQSLYAELRQWQAATHAPRPEQLNPNYDPEAVRIKGRDQRGKGKKK